MPRPGTGQEKRSRRVYQGHQSFAITSFPGISLHGKSVEIVSNTIRSNRTCTIQISNHLGIPLVDPRFYCFAGDPYYPLQPVVKPQTREACSFAQKSGSETGVSGAFTYQCGELPVRLAVMFSVPYNQLQQENNFGLALLDEEEARTKGELACGTLFYKMYFDEEFTERHDRKRRNANRGTPLTVENDKLFVSGNMSERGKGIIKIDLLAKCDVSDLDAEESLGS